MRRFLAAAVAVLMLVLGYGVLDVYDVVPGFLTRAAPDSGTAPAGPSPTPTATAGTPTVGVPTVDPGAQPLSPASAAAPIPSAAGVAAALSAVLRQPSLGPAPGVLVRDAFTGQVLLQRGVDREHVPASTLKLLTALAVNTTLDPLATMPTTVVQGATAGQVVLVAGGDTMLAPGKGRPLSLR